MRLQVKTLVFDSGLRETQVQGFQTAQTPVKFSTFSCPWKTKSFSCLDLGDHKTKLACIRKGLEYPSNIPGTGQTNSISVEPVTRHYNHQTLQGLYRIVLHMGIPYIVLHMLHNAFLHHCMCMTKEHFGCSPVWSV